MDIFLFFLFKFPNGMVHVLPSRPAGVWQAAGCHFESLVFTAFTVAKTVSYFVYSHPILCIHMFPVGVTNGQTMGSSRTMWAIKQSN